MDTANKPFSRCISFEHFSVNYNQTLVIMGNEYAYEYASTISTKNTETMQQKRIYTLKD